MQSCYKWVISFSQSVFLIWVQKQISTSHAAQYDRQTKWSWQFTTFTVCFFIRYFRL